MANGETPKDIASALGIKIKTLEYHRWMMANQLKLSTMTAMVAFAFRHGLVTQQYD